MQRESDLEEADLFEEETKAFVERVMVLPEMKANDKADCPSDSIMIVLSIRALIRVANYNYVLGEEEGRERKRRRTTT